MRRAAIVVVGAMLWASAASAQERVEPNVVYEKHQVVNLEVDVCYAGRVGSGMTTIDARRRGKSEKLVNVRSSFRLEVLRSAGSLSQGR